MPTEEKAAEAFNIQQSKKLRKSKTIWGLLIAAVFAIGGQAAGWTETPEWLGQYIDLSLVQEFKEVVQAVGTAAGLVFAFYGRVKAQVKAVFGG